MKSITHFAIRWLNGLLVAVLLLVPFQGFLTVWLASFLGHYTALRLWDEALLLLGLSLASWLVWRQRLRLGKSGWWLAGLSSAYIFLHLVIGVAALSRHGVNVQALGTGLILNLRPIVVLWLAIVAANSDGWLSRQWPKLLLVPALIVSIFAVLQITVLPHNFLVHFGYSSQTIAAEETIDHNSNYQRAQSTLRGANPLGAYLVIVLAALAVLCLTTRRQKQRYVYGLMGLTTLAALFFSYSRSAWIGAALALGFVGLSAAELRRFRPWLLAGGVLLAGGLGLSVLVLRHNVRFENTFFHTSQASQSSVSSNAGHASALHQGLSEVWHHPFGSGPGSAGPASAHNFRPGTIAENYFVQIAQEVGVLGLAIFVAIMLLVARCLWQQRRQPLVMVLLASLLGLSVVNLLSHAWADDTLALVWWGLAGLVLGSSTAILGKVSKHETHQ